MPMGSTASRASATGSVPRRAIRLGSVSFLNAKPLIYGLENDPAVDLSLEVPSALLEGLRGARYDVALLPVIDYQRMDGLRLLTAGGIGCDGPTLTVRIFSATPVEQVRTLACDTDSHTSVALARVLFAEGYGFVPEMVPLTSVGPADSSAARLLIGDKVVSEEPPGLPHQLDLGEAWKRLTGLPFVFAAWMAREGVELGGLPQRLERAKREGLANVERIIATEAPPRGWPLDTARRYLTEHLQFDIGPRQLEAIERFHSLAFRHGVLPAPPRGLSVVPATDARRP
jgi:chorismate dehydratase